MGKSLCSKKNVWIAKKMKISEFNLSYCLNAFDFSGDWKMSLNRVDSIFSKVREKSLISSKEMLGLGFWTSSNFLKLMQCDENIGYLQKFLKSRNYFISTVNAFPYGVFHNQPVKDKVYLPNWLNEKRVEFTIKAAVFLQKFLPENGIGSISTLPGAYKLHIKSSDHKIMKQIADNLEKVAESLAYIYEATGKKIRLGVEMEPDCIWETPEEFVGFYNNYLSAFKYAPEYIGVCYDTCHQELIESTPGAGLRIFLNNDIPIVKIQLSAALEIQNIEFFKNIKNFDEHVYLHQTRIFNNHGEISEKFIDIPCLKTMSEEDAILKCHFHLPIFWDEKGKFFASARKELLKTLDFLKKNPNICQDIEIETYTYNVLPDCINNNDITSAVVNEYKWVMKCLM
jgi:hypothetical protein